MKIDVKILDPRVSAWGFPRYGSDLAAGLDLHACLEAPLSVHAGEPARLVSSGIAIRIGEAGWFGLVAPRSGLGHRGLVLGNAIGVIDADYEGPILMSVFNRNSGGEPIVIAPGDRIAQLLVVPVVRPTVSIVKDFGGGSARGAGGFGSSGTTSDRRPA